MLELPVLFVLLPGPRSKVASHSSPTVPLPPLLILTCPPFFPPQRDAIRGATFDLMSGQAADQFERLGHDAWASLAEEDRYALQWRVMRGGSAGTA